MNLKMVPAVLTLVGAASCVSDKNHEPADFAFNPDSAALRDDPRLKDRQYYSIDEAPWNTPELREGRSRGEQRLADAVGGMLEFLDKDH